MIMHKIYLTTFLLLGGALSYAQKALTLDEAIKFAMQNNISIRTSQVNIADAEARIMENRATGLPSVKATLDWQTFYLVPKVALPSSFANGTSNAVFGILGAYGVKDKDGNPIPSTPPVDPNASTESVKIAFQQRHSITPGISASQLFFSGSYQVAKKAAREYRDLVQKQLVAKQNEVRNQVIDAYLPALLITESVKTLDKNIANLEKLLVETKAFNKEGFVESLDVDRLTLSLDNIKTQRANVARSKDLVINALKFTIGAKYDEDVTVSDNIESLLAELGADDLEGTVNFNKRPEYGLILQGEKMQDIPSEMEKYYYAAFLDQLLKL